MGLTIKMVCGNRKASHYNPGDVIQHRSLQLLKNVLGLPRDHLLVLGKKAVEEDETGTSVETLEQILEAVPPEQRNPIVVSSVPNPRPHSSSGDDEYKFDYDFC